MGGMEGNLCPLSTEADEWCAQAHRCEPLEPRGQLCRAWVPWGTRIHVWAHGFSLSPLSMGRISNKILHAQPSTTPCREFRPEPTCSLLAWAVTLHKNNRKTDEIPSPNSAYSPGQTKSLRILLMFSCKHWLCHPGLRCLTRLSWANTTNLLMIHIFIGRGKVYCRPARDSIKNSKWVDFMTMSIESFKVFFSLLLLTRTFNSVSGLFHMPMLATLTCYSPFTSSYCSLGWEFSSLQGAPGCGSRPVSCRTWGHMNVLNSITWHCKVGVSLPLVVPPSPTIPPPNAC